MSHIELAEEANPSSPEARSARSGRLRIAFVSPEYPRENAGTSGGIASYLQKIIQALQDHGHEPEVFAIGSTGVCDIDGTRVEYVRSRNPIWTRIVSRSLSNTPLRCGRLLRRVVEARVLSCAVRRRDRDRPFDAIQCSSFGLTGLFLKRRPSSPILVRCGSARELCEEARTCKLTVEDRIEGALERRTIRKASFSYCPSRTLADYYFARNGLVVDVIRPPLRLAANVVDSSHVLPRRFLVHAGSLSRLKGTDLVVQAALKLRERVPDIKVVLVGPTIYGLSAQTIQEVQEASCILNLGKCNRSTTLGIIRRSVASLVPSRVDNLPNVAIESLLLGVPVIGTYGSSVDELVVNNENGVLIPQDDVDALAKAMLRAWNGEPPFSPHTDCERPSLLLQDPDEGVERLLEVIARLKSGMVNA